MAEGGEVPRRRQVPGLPVRLHCKADPNFSLAIVPGQGPVMLPTDPQDDYQIWYKDETVSTRVKDETGSPAFSLINKATGEALRHAPEDLKQCFWWFFCGSVCWRRTTRVGATRACGGR
jgi:hypothetical protein